MQINYSPTRRDPPLWWRRARRLGLPAASKLPKWFFRLRHPAWLGTLRRTQPLSSVWGFDRGMPIDRYYIEHFLSQHRHDIRGRVLEIKDSGYTDRFGTGVERRDVLDIDATNPRATIVTDLAAAGGVPSESYDCFILTQTLHLIYDLRAAVQQSHRMLQPGGALLATLPCLSRVSQGAGVQGDYWRFTMASSTQLFGEIFGMQQLTVFSYGNVLTAIAFLSGMAQEELSHQELDLHDEFFPVLLGVRAVKA